MESGSILSEWTDSREAGALGFRLVAGEEPDEIWLEMRVQSYQGGPWSEWEEEDLDGPGRDLLIRLPELLREERARTRPLLERCLALLKEMPSTGVDEVGRLRGDIATHLEAT